MTRCPLPAALLLACLFSAAAHAATFTVNSSADDGDANPGDGLCATAAATCTLRAAIQEANHWGGPDTIQFGFGGAPTTIAPATVLPNITSQVTIDGYANGSGVPNTLAQGTNATITVRIDGASLPGEGIGLQFLPGASSSVLRGLALTRFSNVAVSLFGLNEQNKTNAVRVLGNFIGTDGSGSPDDVAGLLAGRRGVLIGAKADGGQLGSDGADAMADRNLIVADPSSADGRAVDLGNVVAAGIYQNLIGTDRSGNQRRGAAMGVQVGECTQCRLYRNVIGALHTGVYVVYYSRFVVLQGNRIGVGADGVSPIGGSGHGVDVTSPEAPQIPSYVSVGGTGAGDGNTIAYWGGSAIRVDHPFVASGDYPEGNHWQGNSIHSNGTAGVDLVDTAFNQGSSPASPPVWALRAPMIASASGSAGGTQVNTTLLNPTWPSATYRIEAFANTVCHASGWGEGATFLGAVEVQAHASGGWAGALALPAMPAGQGYVTLTATLIGKDGFRESSEFSRCVAVQMQGGGQGGGGQGTPPAVAAGSASAPAGQPFSHSLVQHVAATEGDPILAYALPAVLPDGLAFDTATGLLTGTPTTPGTYPLMLSATDKDGTASAVFTLTVTGVGGPGNPGNPGGPGGGNTVAVPTLGHAGLLLLSGLVGALGWRRKRYQN
ncbi:MAG: IPTL-CTERM sorting domain-containing protein [Acidovorax sp.]|nr:IPTL-CTERM sorting domain-containing protein [Acidovorax sp.]